MRSSYPRKQSGPRQQRLWRLVVIGALVACLWVLRGGAGGAPSGSWRLAPGARAAHASWTAEDGQQPEEWTPAVQLSAGVVTDAGTPASSTAPVLVADPAGGVHAFWVSTYQEGFPVADTLYYAWWDGEAWSQPVDILYLPGTGINLPRAALDGEGWLHLVWTGLGLAWYSRARAPEASWPGAWSSPLEVSSETASNAFVAAGADGVAHVAYCAIQEDGYVSYVQSADGRTWSAPVRIQQVQSCYPRLVLDGRGRLHLVYADARGSDAGTAVYYTRSEDGGASWLPSREVDVKDARFIGDYGPTWPSVFAIGDDEIHIVWDGAPAGQRWHQWSADGGGLWSQASQISAVLRGLTWPNALALDSAGRLHMVSMGWLDTAENPHGPFHTYWSVGRWWPVELVGERSDWDAEGPSLAIVGGNWLQAAWWNRADGDPAHLEVWTSSLAVNAPAEEVRPWPTPTAGPASASGPAGPTPQASAMAAQGEEAGQATPAATFPAPGTEVGSSGSTSNSMLFALVPVLLLLGVVVAIYGRRWLR